MRIWYTPILAGFESFRILAWKPTPKDNYEPLEARFHFWIQAGRPLSEDARRGEAIEQRRAA